MFSHIMVGTDDLNRSRQFYEAVLATLGFEGEPFEHVNETGQTRLFYLHNGGTFCISEPINGEPASVANGNTIGFRCESGEQAKAFHDAALANGGVSIEEPPGFRERTAIGQMYLAYVRDPDGHKLCAMYRGS
ncbi:VOC family protein [Hyphobacterium sp.]|uniref:VOC family protein n=1 Tax=Hyphobacterium sp. TaxID=2004662 RepID=UPI003BAD22C8